MTKLIVLIIIMILTTWVMSSAQTVNWSDCVVPQSYSTQTGKSVDVCDFTDNTEAVGGYLIRIAVLSEHKTVNRDLFSLEIGGKYYYYYLKFFTLKSDADKFLAASKQVFPKIFCSSAYVVSNPLTQMKLYK